MLQARIPVVLASASPRRRELLSRLFAEFQVVEPDVDEELLRTSDPWETARASSGAKADLVFGKRTEALVIGGDTVVAVAFDGERSWRQLGKPVSGPEAVEMLEILSGRKHAVISAVAVRSSSGTIDFDETSWVTFRTLDRPEIEEYVASNEPMDKAGAYAIQGGARGFVTSVEGELSTVVGLPVERLESELIASGLAFRCSSATI